jgi:hypothetical protein
MQTLEQALETYDLVSDVELRRCAAKTLKGFKMGIVKFPKVGVAPIMAALPVVLLLLGG